jgi:hypothetical protein
MNKATRRILNSVKVLLGIASLVATPSIGCQSGDSMDETQHKVRLTEIEMQPLVNTIRTVRLIKSVGEEVPDNWPASIDEVDPERLTDDDRRDAWGNKYRVSVSADQIEIRSAGPNGDFNDSDDIVLAEPTKLSDGE